MDPLYTAQNCTPAYQLNWSLSLFWKSTTVSPEHWLEPLQQSTEPDGVRILEHRIKDDNVGQFFLSSQPQVAPSGILRSVKGRLQHAVRDLVPKAFRRNYSLHSVGSAKREVVEQYVEGQLGHHPMADPNVQKRMAKYQITNREADLSKVRYSSYGQFRYNLHLVIVNRARDVQIDDDVLSAVQTMIRNAARKKGHLLSRGRILADHIHLTLGCDVKESPLDVALGYLNNLAYAQGMRDVYEYSFYVGTFGEYDRGAIRQALSCQS